MGTNHIKTRVFNSPDEAPNYNKMPEFKLASIDEAVIVRNGTTKGNATVDLIFTDQDGNKYIAMITAKLLAQVTLLAGVTDL